MTGGTNLDVCKAHEVQDTAKLCPSTRHSFQSKCIERSVTMLEFSCDSGNQVDSQFCTWFSKLAYAICRRRAKTRIEEMQATSDTPSRPMRVGYMLLVWIEPSHLSHYWLRLSVLGDGKWAKAYLQRLQRVEWVHGETSVCCTHVCRQGQSSLH